jgi:hypothetical protein
MMSRYLLGGAGCIALLLVTLYGWRAIQSGSQKLLPIGLPQEEGWGDLRLPVTNVNCTSPGVCRIIAMGLYQNQKVGITIHVAKIDPNIAFLNDPQHGSLKATSEGIILESQGEPTQNLLRLLSSLYQHPISKFDLPDDLKLTVISLEGNPESIQSRRLKFKVFHHDEEPEAPDYFEMFINPDLPNGVIEFAEKDQGYRLPILRAFGGKL